MIRIIFRVVLLMLCLLIQLEAQDSVGAQKIAIPSYFAVQDNGSSYGSTEWDRLLLAQNLNQNGIVVINPCSGPEPGSCSFLDFQKTQAFYRNLITTIKSKTNPPKVLGYIPANYGRRSIAAVLRDIQRYQEIYETQSIQLDGYFIDEVNGFSCGRMAFYKRIFGTTKKQNRFLVLNAGTEIAGCYINLADVFVTFENTADQYINNFTTRPLETPERSNRFWHIVHATSPQQLQQVVCLSKNRNAGYVYATNITGNLYGQFPINTYWSNFLSLTSAQQCNNLKENLNINSSQP